MSQHPQIVTTTIDQWFEQRHNGMLDGLDDLWKEVTTDMLEDTAVKMVTLKGILQHLMCIHPVVGNIWSAAVEPIIDTAYASAASNRHLLSHQAEIKNLLEAESEVLRKKAHENAINSWQRFTNQRCYDDKAKTFLQSYIEEVFESDYIDRSVRDAPRVSRKEVRREFKQRIRSVWMKKNNPRFATDSDKKLFHSLFREVVDRTVGRPENAKGLWMRAAAGGGPAWRFPNDITRFYRDWSYLHAAAGLNRIFVIQDSKCYYGIHWRGHLFNARRLTGVAHYSDQAESEAVRLIRAAQSIR